MRVIVTVLLLLGALGGCATGRSTVTNPEGAQSSCKGTWDSRTNTCIGG